MKVITANPVYINKNKVNTKDMYIPFDGTNKEQVKAFQNFANSKGWSPALVVDGVNGSKTQEAAKMYGDAFDAVLAAAAGVNKNANAGQKAAAAKKALQNAPENLAAGKGIFDTVKGWFHKGGDAPAVDPGTGAAAPTPADPTKPAGMSNTKKLLIGGGIAVAVIAIVYFATRKKK